MSFVPSLISSYLRWFVRSFVEFFVALVLRSHLRRFNPLRSFAGSFVRYPVSAPIRSQIKVLRSSPILPDADHLDRFVNSYRCKASRLLRRFVHVSGPHNNAFVSVHHIRLPMPEHRHIDAPLFFIHALSSFVPSFVVPLLQRIQV